MPENPKVNVVDPLGKRTTIRLERQRFAGPHYFLVWVCASNRSAMEVEENQLSAWHQGHHSPCCGVRGVSEARLGVGAGDFQHCDVLRGEGQPGSGDGLALSDTQCCT